jgi:hypothetical protein
VNTLRRGARRRERHVAADRRADDGEVPLVAFEQLRRPVVDRGAAQVVKVRRLDVLVG